MSKSMCKWKKKDIEKDLDELIRIKKNPKYICRKCGRVAADKKQVCKPQEI